MKRSIFVIAASALVLVVSSCKINNSNTTTPPVSSFAVVHASPDAPNLNVYANGGVVVQNFAYGSDTGYYVVQPGIYNIQMVSAATSAALVNQDVTIEPNKAYSIFAIDSLSKIKAVAVEDNFTVPSSDSVRIRFLHFSPNAPAVDILNGSTILFSNRNFNDQQTNAALAQFTTIAAGTYNLEVNLAGSSTSVLSLPNTVLQGGKVYTIYAKGFAGGLGTQALGVGTIIHNESN
ncbi:MAG TPA: DUF4397 domain-containing protein [Panacibacter sp.]|nr:DUF4397 domain-containing protein [Panacibacter sp.]